MPLLDRQAFRHLDQCIPDLAALNELRTVLEKIERCCAAVQGRANLADILSDPENRRTIQGLLGSEGYEPGMQLILRLALKGHTVRSFTVQEEIRGQERVDMLYRAVGGWKQFDSVLVLQFHGTITVLNPTQQPRWKEIEAIPAGTLATVYFKTAMGKRVVAQEQLAAERFEAIFDAVHAQAVHTPMAVVGSARAAAPKPKPRPRPRAPSPATISTAGPPTFELQVVINKMDTFVHAGNAHLIISHVHDYAGRIQLYALRGDKKRIQMDADSIWAAEIRNGERILFEFFGPMPSEQFVKELAKKVNKYTQMDKVANE